VDKESCTDLKHEGVNDDNVHFWVDYSFNMIVIFFLFTESMVFLLSEYQNIQMIFILQ